MSTAAPFQRRTRKELTRLHEAGLLNRERVGNQVQYSANRSHQIYPELAGILRKTVGLADVLSEALTPLAQDVTVAFVFGSVARGTETTGSDVDLLIIGEADFGSVVDALHPAQQRLGREINPKVFSIPRSFRFVNGRRSCGRRTALSVK